MSLLRRAPKRPSRHVTPAVGLGVFGAVALVLITFFAFTKDIPITRGYQFEAVFQSSNGLRKSSPVRIAGVEVGKVVGFRPGPGATRIVRFDVGDRGRPIHRDAILKIRPRLFLEGGYYVDLEPGSPSAPELDDGAVVPLPQTKIPVQFDQILSTFDIPVRASLRRTIAELDAALDDGGAAAAAKAAGPLGSALRDTAIVSEAARGTRDDDVSRLVAGAAKATAALASRRQNLGALLGSLAITSQTLARESRNVRASLRGIDGLLRTAPSSLDEIVKVLPDAEGALADLRPGLRRAPKVLPQVDRLLRQLRLASRPAELPGLLDDLEPTLNALPLLSDRLTALFPLVTPVSDCVRERVVPVLTSKVDDGALSTDRPIWQEIAAATVGLSGASGGFDANGYWVRYLGTVGDQTVSTGVVPGLGSALVGTASQPILGVRPTWLGPGVEPPLRPDVPCMDNAPPNLKSRTGGGAPMRRGGGIARKGAGVTATGLERLMKSKALRTQLRPAGKVGRR